ELQYKYLVKDYFAIGASIPYIFVINQEIWYNSKLSKDPLIHRDIYGKYEKQSTGLIFNTELRPGFAKNRLCLHTGFGYLYHTIHRIKASRDFTRVNLNIVHEENDTKVNLSNRFEYIFNTGIAFQAKIHDKIALRCGSTYFYMPGIQSDKN